MFIILWADFSQKLPRFSKEFTNFVKKDDQFSSGKNPDLEELVHVDKQFADVSGIVPVLILLP